MTKKLLYFCIVLGTFNLVNGQVLLNDNYNTLTIGNVGTDVAGTAAGQGGYYTFATGGANTNFQIVADTPAQGNVVQLTGSATATGSKFMYKDISAAWGTRTIGNNVINVEFDLFTGPATTSKNSARVYIYNDDGSTVLGGLSLNLETKALSGIAYYDNAGTINTYGFNLGTAGAVVTLAANTWVRIGVSYNTTTNQVIWKGTGFYSGVTGAGSATGTNNPGEVDYLHGAGTSNTVSAISKYDNLVVRTSIVENLLGKSDFNMVNAQIANIYPNPVIDFASINLIDTQIIAITVIDINGRIVKTGDTNELSNAKINLSDLTSGIYLLKIETERGITTEKIIKK
jgi:hypothetical protein